MPRYGCVGDGGTDSRGGSLGPRLLMIALAPGASPAGGVSFCVYIDRREWLAMSGGEGKTFIADPTEESS